MEAPALSNVPVPRLGLGLFIWPLLENVMFKDFAASSLVTKVTYGSIATVAIVFVVMMFLTQMHP